MASLSSTSILPSPSSPSSPSGLVFHEQKFFSWQQYKYHLGVLMKLSWPNFLTTLISIGISVTSTLAVGHITGKSTEMLGAVAIGNMFIHTAGTALGAGLAMALDTLCPQAYGARKYHLVGLHCQRAMVILSLFCIPVAILWYNCMFILKLISTEEVANLSQFWIRRLIPSLWPRMMCEAYKKYLISQRIMWPLLASSLLVVPLHALSSYLFVFSFNWGFSGAVWALSLSYWLLFLSLLGFSFLRLFVLRRRSFRKVEEEMEYEGEEEEIEDEEEEDEGEDEDEEEEMDGTGGDPLHTWPDWSRDVMRGWPAFFRLGISTALSAMIELGSVEAYTAFAAQLGEASLAAHGIISSCTSVWYTFPLGISYSATALVGNMLGAGEPECAMLYSRIAIVVAVIYGVINGALGLVYKDYLGKIFTNDPKVVALVSHVMYGMWMYVIVDALKCVSMAILRGSGRPRITVFGNILSCIGIGYPVAFLLIKYDFGFGGIWVGLGAAWFCASSIYVFFIARTNWEVEVLNAAKRNTEAENSTQKGRELAMQGLLMTTVVKEQIVVNEEEINEEM